MERPTAPEADQAATPPSDDQAPGPENLDLASIGLTVFCVALILVVGALLLLPTLF